MIQVTGPAVVIILAIGYLGINSIVGFVDGLFKKNEERRKNEHK